MLVSLLYCDRLKWSISGRCASCTIYYGDTKWSSLGRYARVTIVKRHYYRQFLPYEVFIIKMC